MGFCHAAPHDKSELAYMLCVHTPVTSIAIFLKISLIKASSKNLKLNFSQAELYGARTQVQLRAWNK